MLIYLKNMRGIGLGLGKTMRSKKFDGEFVAIYEQNVVDHDEELSNLMERIREKYPEGNVFVDFVSSRKLMLILEAA